MFYSVVKNIAKIVFVVLFPINCTGLENVPESGSFVLSSNHASNWDPLFISVIFPRQVFWMGKKELFQNKILAFLLNKLGTFPVDRENLDISSIKHSLRLLKDNKVLGVFPEGTRVQGFSLDNVKPGVGLLSIKSKSPILPVYIESDYKLFRKTNIYIGKPIDLSRYYGTRPTAEEYNEIGRDLLENIYNLNGSGGL